MNPLNDTALDQLDPEIAQLIAREKARQQSHIELIASENFTYLRSWKLREAS